MDKFKRKALFDDENDSDSKEEIQLNKDYASKYETWRRKEELNKFKAKCGEDFSEDESSSSDDEDAKELTEEFEKDFFKTLSCLKNKDPRIYDENFEFFKEANPADSSKIETKSEDEKPLYLRDYYRNNLLEKGPELSDSEDENQEDPRAESPTYVEEQKRIKENLKKVLEEDFDNDDNEKWGGIFKKRVKTKEDEEKEEEDYKQWLKGNKEELTDKKTELELKPLKEYWNNPNLDKNESFLRDFMLNKRYLENYDNDYIPTYEEIIHEENLSEDEKIIEEQETFETKYNYRFEEPDQEFIKRYPRTMENSVRKKDDKRKQKRAETKVRKEAEKLKKREELEQLKALKLKEIKEKIEQLEKVTGNTDVGFQYEDLEGDFDPETHDKRMQELFNDEFYKGEENEQKPVFPDLDEELEIENWDKWGKNNNIQNEIDDPNDMNEPHCEDEDFNMDCDYDPTVSHQSEMIEQSRGRKKRRRKSKLAEVLAKKKPVFDPQNKKFEDYLEEYYKLDYEDLIGDLPCRFKYRNVVPNDFGLSVDEILTADDKELNSWCSLKKVVQIRPEHVEKYDVMAYKNKGRNEELKKRTFQSLYSAENETNVNAGSSGEQSKNRNKNKNKTAPTATVVRETVTETENEINSAEKSTKVNTSGTNNETLLTEESGKKKRKKHTKTEISLSTTMSPHGKSEISEEKNNLNNSKDEENHSDITETVKTKKNKKKKQKSSAKTEVDNKKSNDECNSNKKRKYSEANSFQSKEECQPTKKTKFNKNWNKNHKKYNGKQHNSHDIGISDERLKAYGLNPKKYKNKLKYGSKR